jgi:hypothetical protein
MLKVQKDGHEKCENWRKMVMKNVDIIFLAAYNNRRRGFSREKDGACDGTIIDGRSASLEKQKEKKALNYPWSAAGRENMDYEGIWKKVLRELRLYQL